MRTFIIQSVDDSHCSVRLRAEQVRTVENEIHLIDSICNREIIGLFEKGKHIVYELQELSEPEKKIRQIESELNRQRQRNWERIEELDKIEKMSLWQFYKWRKKQRK